MPLPRVLRPPAAERGAAGRAAIKKKGSPGGGSQVGSGRSPRARHGRDRAATGSGVCESQLLPLVRPSQFVVF